MSTHDGTRRHLLRGTALCALAALAGPAAGPALGQATPKPAAPVKPGPRDALVVVDVQNCFTPGGSLAVKDGDAIIPLINKLAKAFQNVVLTQDWHTANHISFASQHPGKKPFDIVKLAYGNQVLWPDHCVQGTAGAELHKGIDIPHAQLVIRKGFNSKVDSYSAFIEADGKSKTGLDGYLKGRAIKNVYVVGLATDFCVGWTALDAKKLGMNATVIEDACRGIDTNGSLAKAWTAMAKAGVRRIQSAAIAA
jgi:nicotinamidase/pyrazinamidase